MAETVKRGDMAARKASPEPGPRHERPFVGREDLIELFLNAVNERFGKPLTEGEKIDPKVLVFHGMAGIGKSRLREELVKKLVLEKQKAVWAVVDFHDDSNRQRDNALSRLRVALGSIHKIKFLEFDLAYAIYWRKAKPQQALTKAELPFLDESSLVADIIATAGELPVVGFVPKVAKVMAQSPGALKNWLKKRGSTTLQRLQQMEPYQVLEQLPAFLAADLKRHMHSSGLPVVLFLDTYEALWESDLSDANKFTRDEWVRDLVKALPEALWVIGGRNKVEWPKRDSFFKNKLEHHELEKLADDDADRYLRETGIDNERIREVIIEGSKGVPIYLDLSVTTYESIVKEGKRQPEPSDFGGTFVGIFESFVRNLRREEILTLKVVCCARRWDQALFGLLLAEFPSGLTPMESDEFHGNSFVRQDEHAATWSLHELLGEHLQARPEDNDLHQQVHQFLFEHYDSKLKEIDIKAITAEQRAALLEAFYHCLATKSAEKSFKWLDDVWAPFKTAAQWEPLALLLEEGISKLSDALGPESVEVGALYNMLAYVYHDQARYAEAEPLYRQAIEMHKKALGKAHPQYAVDLNNLALLYKTQGRYEEAESLYKQAIEIFKETLGEENPLYATNLINLGVLCHAQGRFEEAEPLFRQAIEIDKKTLGEDHPGYATDLNNLALLYCDRGRYEEAEPLYLQALEITRKTLGEEHPSTAIRFSNLALLYYAQGQYAEAEPLLFKVLRIMEATFGKVHPHIAATFGDLAVLYQRIGNEKKAREYAARAEAIKRQLEGGAGEDSASGSERA